MSQSRRSFEKLSRDFVHKKDWIPGRVCFLNRCTGRLQDGKEYFTFEYIEADAWMDVESPLRPGETIQAPALSESGKSSVEKICEQAMRRFFDYINGERESPYPIVEVEDVVTG